MVDLSCKIGTVEFDNPVFTASGTFGYGLDLPEWIDVSKLGAIITKSITLEPRVGNPPPRIVETPSGMLNSIGLANIGVERFITEVLPKYRNIGSKVIVNIAGSTHEEYVEVLDRIEGVSSNIAGYEINVSCPNVKEGGMAFGVDPEIIFQLTKDLRKHTSRLLILKLTPNVTDITIIAKAAQDAGADAVSAINTVVGMGVNLVKHKPAIHTIYGGLSGPAIKPIALAAVHKVFNFISIPIIGIGGITCAEDVVEFLLSGANAVQIGTANFRNPAIGMEIVSNLERYCQENKINKCLELVGKLRVCN